MRLWIAAAGARPRAGFEELARMYLERMTPYVSVVEAPVFKSEEALWAAVEKERSRTSPRVVLLDERGKQMGSEGFAAWLGRERDAGRQLVIFAVGPADGWGVRFTGDRLQVAEKRIGDGKAGYRVQGTGYRKADTDSGQRTEKRVAGFRLQVSENHSPGEVMWLSLGSMTMAHELARVVICEQVYRALTILAGHPYHRV